MSRFFDSSDDEVTWTKGSVVGTGALTWVALVRLLDAAGVWASMLNFENAGANQFGFTRNGTSNILMASRAAEANTSNGPGFTSDVGWATIAISKASGAATPSFTVTPVGEASTTTAGSANISDSPAFDSIVFGNMNGVDFFGGRVAALAIYDTALSQADRESLGSTRTRANWLSKTPKFLVDANDVFQYDYAGTSTRSAIVGTANDADDPSGWASWSNAASLRFYP